MRKLTDDITSLIFKWTEVRLAVDATLSDEKCRSFTVLFRSAGTDFLYIFTQYLLNWLLR